MSDNDPVLGNNRRELAELVGEIFMAQGRYAEAVAAFGPRALLSSRGRRLRRGRGGAAEDHCSTDPARMRCTPARRPQPWRRVPPDPPEAVLETITWAKWLSDQDRQDDARQVISEALAEHGRHPRLLACAAKIEDSADAPNSALYPWREAYRAAPQDVDVISGLASDSRTRWSSRPTPPG